MPKPSKKTSSDSLIIFALTSDSRLANPRDWIEKSQTSSFFIKREENKANGGLIEKLHIRLQKTHYAEEKKEIERQIKSIASKMKANGSYFMQIWACAYYLFLKRNNPYITKAESALQIRELLVKSFPENLPKGKSAQMGEIPTSKTIETRWLAEKVIKN
jgi:hypothetical protein